ncbi:ribosome small subunit-dependent GTPase A [Ilyomonas limi]|uniref:Small ribosomal subunit biogenesis GTPase RsgA n=1 Tax=Ilyomonas limi TaxID=2575867 RepID=A0A4U3L5G6_9BACT|nr:ribosome small subunit-dependent GTPase A [Ilyomonas limi]TKK70182.1 ribosome small subunit-dependent GTPase A [Ilyomonas limi]
MRAIIYKSTGSWYIAKTKSGQTFNARIKGIFKIDEITSTNPIAVGDSVQLVPETEEGNTAVITQIQDRKNYIARSSPHSKSQHHIIASNLDQTLLFATVREPRTSQGFIDRFLVSAEAYHVPAIIVFNKADVYRQKDIGVFEKLKGIYEACGYSVIKLSMQTGEGLPELKELLHGKTTLLSGHSGVGKSTFINAVMPGYNLRTTEVSNWSGKGMHTTTFAEMFDLPFGGSIIDTPGIREFGITDISRQELSHYFPEMRGLLNDCRYNNCLHTNEPGCAIKAAVENGTIAYSRYISYLNILDSIEDKHY